MRRGRPCPVCRVQGRRELGSEVLRVVHLVDSTKRQHRCRHPDCGFRWASYERDEELDVADSDRAPARRHVPRVLVGA